MNAAFIVTSAICTDIGIFNLKSRIIQTAGTIKSIKNFAPNSKIILMDGGGQSEDNEFKKIIRYINQNCYIFGKTNLGTPANFGPTKSLYDVYLTKSGLESLIEKNTDNKEKIDRVFRISGRYQISSAFKLKKYEKKEIKDKFVFKEKIKSYIENSGLEYCYSSRLWSFPYEKSHDTLKYLENMIVDLTNSIKNKNNLDFEHVLYKNIPQSEIKEFKSIHVFGAITSNGYLIYD